MPLDEPFGKFTPPPKIPGDSSFDERHRASSADSGAGLRAVQDFLRKYKEVEIETADGKVVTCLVRRVREKEGDPSDWFAVSKLTASRVKVNEGRLLSGDTSGIGSDPPVVTGLLNEHTVAGAELDVEHGSKICLKLTATHPAESAFELTAETDDFVSALVRMEVHRFYSTTGEIVALTTVPAPTTTLSYITLSEISIVDGVMKIKPRHTGAITVPSIITPVLKTLQVTSTLASQAGWLCDNGTSEAVTFIISA